ncbi:gamma-glutamylcyclotransferase [Dyadobacter sp. CY345]|uniref:gamma-glutamylcyclotransferase family protein n=1 Tax=Dyadobacter sp. CY345 TaxID=2909335 RepID=UPI001F3C2D39|nr:gamma-glutamylcyclotransferase family protein [Dyadobacter sp. CY345]MCF2446063.1 gamma-glutamylcyclotransferase [Dyadobacter sp. CY345]
MAADTKFLFTYGTLMRGFPNPFAQRLHSLSTFEGSGTFPGLLYKISWYPGAIYDEDADSQVYGEIYRLEEKEILLKELDEYEDVLEDEILSLYVRKIIPIRMQDGTLISCWVYLYNQDLSSLLKIESGNFRDVSH